MFLRTLRLHGFKSFADPATLEFGPGISCIVGPNGSGKSNIVDAIAWVLGEQGPRALRGAQMADVIFAGSPGRRQMGIAEVAMTIDNEAGLLPVPATEIEVARVVYRSGESQYLIGGEPRRLLDIQDLLSDTGIGRALHTVVAQGQLEDVLLARPEDRRLLIEEAAGIAKHRARKDRAQRKLAGLEQDLLRLGDVVAEVRRQLRPLKHQAEAAQRHETLSTEATDLAARMAAAQLRQLYAQRDDRLSVWDEGRRRRTEAEERLAALDAELPGLSERLEQAERVLTEADDEHSEALRNRSAAEEALREAVRAEAETKAVLAAEGTRPLRIMELEERIRADGAVLEETSRVLGEREAALAEAERAYGEEEGRRREAEEARRRSVEASARAEAEREALVRARTNAAAERDRATTAFDEVSLRATEAAAARDAAAAETERLRAEMGTLEDGAAALRFERERTRAETAELEERERALERKRQGLEGRRAALTDTPGKRLLRRGSGRQIGLLVRLIDVDPGMERALLAGLGSLADAVVYGDLVGAVSDAEEAGGATMAVTEGHADEPAIPGERPLLSVLRPERPVAALTATLLRDVYLATDAEDALARHRRHPEASFVTPEGVLVGPSVVRTAPAPTEELTTVRREEVVVKRDLAKATRELQEKRTRLEDLEAGLARIAREAGELEERAREADRRAIRSQAELGALERERAVLAERASRAETAVGDVEASLAVEEPPPQDVEIPPAADPPLALRVEVEALRRDRSRVEADLATARDRLAGLRGQGGEAAAEAASAAATRREEAEEALTAAADRVAETAGRREDAARAAREIRQSEGGANRRWREAAAALQRLRDEYEEEDQARRDLERRIEDAERVIREGHGRDPSEMVAALEDEEDVEGLRKRADLVARRLGLLGRVNLVAGEEYRTLQERHDFLRREIDDVKSARRDLNEVVRDVDRKIVEIFDAAYRDVAREFTDVFRVLFPEGEGRLTLSDRDNLLEAGIEIEARPGRRKVKRLSLLSGGERALASLAFLFAIFRARPSPFYLLDEVEAALDDMNLHRFLDLVRDFARTSQVILVTHQKRTMEAADVLYGVTMGQDGTSTVVAQRLQDVVKV